MALPPAFLNTKLKSKDVKKKKVAHVTKKGFSPNQPGLGPSMKVLPEFLKAKSMKY